MNINDLNKKLFSTLEGLEKGSLDVKTAAAIVKVSSAINDNYKLMIDVAKISGDYTEIEEGVVDGNKIGYDSSLEFAKRLGYKTVAEAIRVKGKDDFLKAHNKWKKGEKIDVI